MASIRSRSRCELLYFRHRLTLSLAGSSWETLLIVDRTVSLPCYLWCFWKCVTWNRPPSTHMTISAAIPELCLCAPWQSWTCENEQKVRTVRGMRQFVWQQEARRESLQCVQQCFRRDANHGEIKQENSCGARRTQPFTAGHGSQRSKALNVFANDIPENFQLTKTAKTKEGYFMLMETLWLDLRYGINLNDPK